MTVAIEQEKELSIQCRVSAATEAQLADEADEADEVEEVDVVDEALLLKRALLVDSKGTFGRTVLLPGL
jgi:hypothetical protein